MITIEDFLKLDLRCGEIVEVKSFPEAKKPSFKLLIDFGDTIGLKRSCAQFVQNYSPEELLHKLIIAVVNLPPRKIGPEISEVLVLGLPDSKEHATLLCPDRKIALGARVY